MILWRKKTKIDVRDLLDAVPALRSPGVRIGYPDDPTPLSLRDPQLLAASLDAVLSAFREPHPGSELLVNAEVSSYHKSVSIGFMLGGICEDSNGSTERTVEPTFHSLQRASRRNGGEAHSGWIGNICFVLSFPFRGPFRESLPKLKHRSWDRRYRYLLKRASWGSVRGMVFRFSNLAETVAARCVEFGLSRVLIPSVGLCVHPWLFADHGLKVIATDSADTALAAVSEPADWPKLFSRAAFERWDISESALYATIAHPDRFTRMPELEDAAVRARLRERIEFAKADWAELPLENGGTDAIFATNALPRESEAELVRVLKEWVRVVRPGGIVFIAQHNFYDRNIEPILRDAGWVESNLTGGEGPPQPDTTGFQIRYSSG